MKKLSTIFILACICLLSSCKKCPMQVDKWQTIQKGADVDKQMNALTELVAAADGEIAQIENLINSGNAEGKLNLKWSLAKEAKKSTYKETVYDKEVWQDMKLAQQAYCALYAEVKEGFYKTPESYKDAQAQLKETRNFLLQAKKKLEE